MAVGWQGLKKMLKTGARIEFLAAGVSVNPLRLTQISHQNSASGRRISD
jgi:hypothetical protein